MLLNAPALAVHPFTQLVPTCSSSSLAPALHNASMRTQRRKFIIIICSHNNNKKLSYRRGTAQCVVSVEILSIATQRCRNYLYDKS